MRIGVELALPADAGELFADARAYEAAGADSFWVASETEAAVLLAGVAAVTWRARLVLEDRAASDAARATLERLARGRLAIAERDGPSSRIGAEAGDERWERVPFPSGRDVWKELVADREAAGVAGLVLANDPRLLDLLRNPDVVEDRSDLKLAQG